MSRPLRIEYPNAWHHVMNRARRGESLYTSKDDYRHFVDLLQETTDMFNIYVAAYCLMSTHYHLLVQTPNANLARCMRHINGVYTQRYNRHHKCDGTLFRGRYKSILIDADSYLLQLVRYIHRNPVKCGFVEQLDQYPWSSHKGYISNSRKWDWLHKDFILSMLSLQKNQRIIRYKQFVRKPDSEEINQFFDKKSLPVILGGNKFIDWIKENFFNKKTDREVPASKTLAPSIDKIKEVVCRFYHIDEGSLLSARRGTENEPRNVTIYLMRFLCGEPLLTIGTEFNLKKHSSVSSVLERTQKRLNKDHRFRNRLKRLEGIIRKGQTET